MTVSKQSIQLRAGGGTTTARRSTSCDGWVQLQHWEQIAEIKLSKDYTIMQELLRPSSMEGDWRHPADELHDLECSSKPTRITFCESLKEAFQTSEADAPGIYGKQQLAAGESQRLWTNSQSGGICMPRVSCQAACGSGLTTNLPPESAALRLNITTINSLAIGLVQLRLSYSVPAGEGTDLRLSPSGASSQHALHSSATQLMLQSAQATSHGALVTKTVADGHAVFRLCASHEPRLLKLSCVSFAFPTFEGHVAALSAAIPTCKGRSSFSVMCFLQHGEGMQSVYGYTHALSPTGQCSEATAALHATARRLEWSTCSTDGITPFGVCVAINPSVAHALHLWSSAATGRGDNEAPWCPFSQDLLPQAPDAQSRARPFLVPSHVAIIMDGNGRWAKQRGLSRSAGHSAGVDAIHRVIRACRRMQVRYLTLYAFSAQNWDRPAAEVAHLMGLLEHFVFNDCQALVQNGVRLLTVGDTDRLPSACRDGLKSLAKQSASNTDLTLVLALSYGGREELATAAAAAAEDVAAGKLAAEDLRMRPSVFGEYLPLAKYNVPDPDLLIRTSGEMRISNFLLWQIAYAELHVTEELWPNFTEQHLAAAFAEYSTRERRFGLTGEQISQPSSAPACTGSAPRDMLLVQPADTHPRVQWNASSRPCDSPQPHNSSALPHAELDDVWVATGRPVTQSSSGTRQWLCCASWGLLWVALVASIRFCVLLASVLSLPAPPALPACLRPPGAIEGGAKQWDQLHTLPLSAQAAVQSGALWFSQWLYSSVRHCSGSLMLLLLGGLGGAIAARWSF